MSSAIIRRGHWRRRDMLEGLSPAMCEALALFAAGPLGLHNGSYRLRQAPGAPPQTVAALAERGLVRRSAGPEGTERRFVLTPAGAEIVAELRRRQAARAALIADSPSRARSFLSPR